MTIKYNPYNWEIRPMEKNVDQIVKERRVIINNLCRSNDNIMHPKLMNSLIESLMEKQIEYIKVCIKDKVFSDEQILSWFDE